MSIVEFMNLSEPDKVRALNCYGSFVAERRLGPDRIYLYALSYFYVEVLHKLSDTKCSSITMHRVFRDGRYLDAYLEHIDISEIIAIG